jgi:hypothetical protein
MSWLTELFGYHDSDLDDELEVKRRKSEQAKEQAEHIHQEVIVPMAREAKRSIGTNHYAEVLAKAYNLRRGQQS